MAQHERDDLADALAAMSSGQSPPTTARATQRAASAPAQAPEELASSTHEQLTSYPQSAPTPLAAQRPKPALSQVLAQSLEYKRTLIPILLTFGVLLPLLGVLPWFLSDSLIGEMPKWAIVCSFLTGALLLALAIANMVQVKHQMAKMPSSQPRSVR